MPVSSVARNFKQRVKIVSVDPSQRQVQGVMSRTGVIEVAIWEIDGYFRWPRVGEWWSVEKKDGLNWTLGQRLEDLDTSYPIENLNAGEAKINSDTLKTESGFSIFPYLSLPIQDEPPEAQECPVLFAQLDVDDNQQVCVLWPNGDVAVLVTSS